jgi:hypothetical protein
MWRAAEIEEVSALVIAYQRPDNVEEILSRVVASGIKNIYVSLDYPRLPNSESLHRREEIIRLVEKLALNPSLQIRLSTFSQNVGCGVAVTTACDWFFDSVNLGVVIEDDCIPTPGFFSYMRYALIGLINSKNSFIASGSRLHPLSADGMHWELNGFPIFWGWGSTASKWKQLSIQIKEPLPLFRKYPSRFSIQSFYWRAGSRRVREGFVDTWDTLISELFYRNSLYNLSPSVSLVQNIGNDEHATHKMDYLSGLPAAHESFKFPTTFPIFDPTKNSQCGKFLYKYSARHIVTTFLTKLLDRTIRFHLADKPFADRLKIASNFYNETKVN